MSADHCHCCCLLPCPSSPVRDPIPYSKAPESAYQAKIRGKATQLQDHICKEMNHVNLHRCRCGRPRQLRPVLACMLPSCGLLRQGVHVALYARRMQWVLVGSCGCTCLCTASFTSCHQLQGFVFQCLYACSPCAVVCHVLCCAP